MLTKTEARDFMDEIFEEEALVIGGLAAVGEIDGDLVRRLVESLNTIRTRAIRRLDDGDEDVNPLNGTSLKPHPAIEEFLLKIRRK